MDWSWWISRCLVVFLWWFSSVSALRFSEKGEFKILQVADMHYAEGKTSACLDVLPDQFSGCSDLNTTAFVEQMIRAEKPDLIVFTGSPWLPRRWWGCLHRHLKSFTANRCPCMQQTKRDLA